MAISVRQISKTFGKQQVLDQLSLEIHPGKFVSLLGPSGCGKTTLLRIIAGLEKADRGHVFFHGQDTAGWDFAQRKVGFVFQNYALFRHMTVAENISFGLRMKARKDRPDRATQAKKVQELLALVQLENFGKRYPHQLSGGQRQRVALARALAIEPQILLLDEPFGALDAKVRKDLRGWLRDLQQKLGITALLVTHDQDEAMEISDHVVLMNQGRIEQQGSPEDLFEHPASAFALGFLGQAQTISGADDGPGFVRPHEIEIFPEAGRGRDAALRRISLRGSVARLQLAGADGSIAAEISREQFEQLAVQVGDSISWKPKKLHTFSETERTKS